MKEWFACVDRRTKIYYYYKAYCLVVNNNIYFLFNEYYDSYGEW